MPNNCSPHGGSFHTGSISHGTLRPQDLLRSFAEELERLLPFNGAALAQEAYEAADALDADVVPGVPRNENAGYVLDRLTDALDEIAAAHDAYFGTLEGDGSDFGFWPLEDENAGPGESTGPSPMWHLQDN